LTPDSDSDSDLEIDDGELGESYKLQTIRNDVEKRISQGDFADEEDGEENHRPRRRRASVSTVQSYQLYTPEEERAVVRKFDRRLVLFVALLYMLSFLDRSSMDAIGRNDGHQLTVDQTSGMRRLPALISTWIWILIDTNG
jgi:hypothetical protein